VINKVDVDVLHGRIANGLAGRFEAELVAHMAECLITGKPLVFIYNDLKYTIVASAKRV